MGESGGSGEGDRDGDGGGGGKGGVGFGFERFETDEEDVEVKRDFFNAFTDESEGIRVVVVGGRFGFVGRGKGIWREEEGKRVVGNWAGKW